MKDKAIVLISDGDLDGTSSRILLEWFLIPFNKVLIQQSRIGFDFKLLLNQLDLSKIDVIGFADLAPDPLIYSHLLTFPNLEVHIWDHHVTSRQTLNSLGLPNKNYHYEEDKCSSLNIYNYFKDCGNRPYKKIVHDFAKYVNIWDIWLSDDKDFYWAKGLHNLLYKTCNKYGYERGYTQFVNVQLKKFECLDEYEFFDDELKMIKEEQEREDSYFERAIKELDVRADRDGNIYGYFETNSKISILCSRILDYHPKLDYVVCHSTYIPAEKKLSFRSRHVDVAKIAKRYGGGGHAQASGVGLPKHPKLFDKIQKGKWEL